MARMSFTKMNVGDGWNRNGNLVSYGALDAQGKPLNDVTGYMLNHKGQPVQSTGVPLPTAPKPKRNTNTQRKGSMRPKSGIISQPTSGATTGNPQYDALLKLQQQQAGLTDLERLRQQLLSGDALNDAARLMQRGFISQVPKSFNTLG